MNALFQGKNGEEAVNGEVEEIQTNFYLSLSLHHAFRRDI